MPVSKGKKRAVKDVFSDDEQPSEASQSATPEPPKSARAREKQPAAAPPVKKPKRAETRNCPVCDEPIPLRLLGKHAELEAERLQEIIACIGSTEVLGEAEPDDGLTARTRRSALKARRNLRPGAPSGSGSSGLGLALADEAALEQTAKTLRALKRRRKQRHARLRELTREDGDGPWWEGRHGAGAGAGEGEGEGMACPVCAKFVRGDVDVVEAHVDACLAHVRIVNEQEEGRRGRGSADVDGDVVYDVDLEGDDGMVGGVMEGVSFRGTGFDIRNRRDQDVEDDIDVDGEDETMFGAAQFTEQDVLAPQMEPVDIDGAVSDAGTDVNVGAGDAAGGGSASGEAREPKRGSTLRDLVAEGKVIRQQTREAKHTMDEVMGLGDTDQADLAIELARRAGDQGALVRALESKVLLLESTKVSSSTSLLCRICLDPYTEPTVSTGCWHTCCRECWLRCLGSTKLCPICKRITGAADLRRVYL